MHECLIFKFKYLYTHLMIRQKSLCTIKEIIKDKPTITRNPSLKHLTTENSHRKYVFEDTITKRQINQPKKKNKKSINSSKDKLISKGKIKEETSMNKRKKSQYLKTTLKQDKNIMGNVLMKKQLKLLVSKNTSKNIQKPSQQTQFLKKIQKFRQDRKKSDKQLKTKTNASLSQRSAQNIKQQKQKEKKGISPSKVYKKLQPQSLNASKHIQNNQNHKYHFGLKSTRFSLQSNPIGVQKSQIEQALLNKPKKQQTTIKKEEQKNSFLDIFKKYKKSFDIEAIQFQKDMKSHQNVNSKLNNRSNNTSQLSLMGLMSKSTSQNIKLNKSETPQDCNNKQIANMHQFHIKQSQSLIKQPSQDLVKLKISSKLIKKIDINMEPKKPNHYFTQDKDSIAYLHERHQIINQSAKQKIIHEEKIVQFQLYQQQSNVQQQNYQPTSNQSTTNKQNAIIGQANDQELQLNSKFQVSKYYVQPIPAFKQKTKSNIQFQSPILNKDYEDNSLLGCEIALIEKNIVLDQQQLDL